MFNINSHNGAFWKGKKCLVTGANGFLAVHLISSLLNAGALVYGTIRHIIRPASLLELYNLKEKIVLVSCDIRNYRGLRELIISENIDTVFHIAASAIVNVSARSPLSTIETNVLGTVNVLEACRNSNVERIIVASSDKAYGDHRSNLPYRESHQLQGLHVYDCSKSCTDLIAQTYYFQYHLPVKVTRCSNLYGPGDLNFSRLIPGTVIRFLLNRPANIHQGQRDVKREYLFVDDAVKAYLSLAKSINNNEKASVPRNGEQAYSHCSYNIGSGEVRSTFETIEAIKETMRIKIDNEIEETCNKGAEFIELPDQYLDYSKINNELGWQPETAFNSGLKKTIKWYSDHLQTIKSQSETVILNN